MEAAGADRAAIVAEQDQHSAFVRLQGEVSAGRKDAEGRDHDAGKQQIEIRQAVRMFGRDGRADESDQQQDRHQEDQDIDAQHSPTVHCVDSFFAVHDLFPPSIVLMDDSTIISL